MPAILLWLFGALADLALVVLGWVLTWITKRGLAIVAVATLFAALLAGFYASINAAVGFLSVELPPGFSQACGLFLPGNVTVCMSTYFAVVAARFLYDQAVRLLQLRVTASA